MTENEQMIPAEEQTERAEEQKPTQTPPPVRDAATAAMRSAISVPGTINAAVYRSIKKYLMPPVMKIIMLVILVAYEAVMLYEVIANGYLANIVLMVISTALFIGIYFYNQTSAVKHILKNNRELANHGYRVLITFAGNIKLLNHTTGAERNLPFADIISMAETDQCIVLFAKGRKYLMVPKNEMTEDQRTAVLDIIHKRCPKLKKRW